MANEKIKYDAEANKLSFGSNGFNNIQNGTIISADDRFSILEAEDDTVFSFENESEKGITISAAYTLRDGRFLYGYFKNIVVTSGKLIAYYGN
tara:strand:- start:1303 stop:1581 length:279 start_codon:yes stop_codon:yes gene_type:complete